MPKVGGDVRYTLIQAGKQAEFIPKPGRKFGYYGEFVASLCSLLSGTKQMAVDISLTGGRGSRHLARIYRSTGKDLLSGLCLCPHLDAVLYQWTFPLFLRFAS